jgi:ribosome-binding factor A
MKQQRQQRIDHEIQRELARVISMELKDPRLGFVTVTRVEVTTDLHTAKVFVSIIGDRHVARQSMDALKSAAGYMRGELGAAVKLRHTPELVFVEDRTTERAIALSGVLAKAAAKDAAAATVADVAADGAPVDATAATVAVKDPAAKAAAVAAAAGPAVAEAPAVVKAPAAGAAPVVAASPVVTASAVAGSEGSEGAKGAEGRDD